MSEIFTQGALEDPRPPEVQTQNWDHAELFGSAAPYVWKEKPMAEWKSYPIRNQNGSGKCGPFALCKALGVNNLKENGEYVDLDTDFIYGYRSNDDSGMWMDEVFGIGCNRGAPKDPLLLSDNNNDQQSAERFKTFTDEQRKEALKYRGRNRVYITTGFDAVAQAIEMGYTPIFRLNCSIREWTAEPFVDPTVTPQDFDVRHFVPAVEATIYKNQECIVIEDSWGSSYGANGRRIISRHFFNNRVTAVGYIIDLRNEDIDKPRHTFNLVLTYGSLSPEVLWLQKILQYEKFLPTHLADGTPLVLGRFGPLTARAVKDWQVAHGIMDFANVVDMRKIRFGLKSIAMANSIYS